MIAFDLLFSSPSYLSLLSLNSNNFYYQLFILLSIDMFFANTHGIITIICLVLSKMFLSINNYYLRNLGIYICFVIITSFVFDNKLKYILIYSFVPQVIGIILYKKTYDLTR